MKILGISCYYHESTAALIVDGTVVAAIAEERLSRIKHDDSFPKLAIDFCLKQAGMTAEELDYVVYYEKPLVKFERTLTMAMHEYPFGLSFFVSGMTNAFVRNLWIRSAIIDHLGIPKDRIVFVPQHISHAAAGFYPSPFSECAYLTLDAVGEWSTGSWGICRGTKLFPHSELRFPHSVGLLYSAMTRYLGFEVNDGEFKVMGMAAYGKPKHADRIRKLFRLHLDGSIGLNMSYFSFHRSNSRMYTAKFEELFHPCSPFDLAASMQQVAEDIIFGMMKHVAAKTRQKNLVFSGGVALNSVVNGMITRKTPFANVYIYPAAGDDGAAVGAALYLYHHVLGYPDRHTVPHVFLGNAYTDSEIRKAIAAGHKRYTVMKNFRLVQYISGQLARGKVVGWFEGRSEFGPRALGHRSILADPRSAEMKDIVNARIKFREEFRPFAPVVLARFAGRYFRITEKNLVPYMLGTFKAKPVARKRAPAVVHDDRTSRIQVIDPRTYPGRYAKLLAAFYKRTGVPVLLNTSFNLKGEPIVNSPADAISTFEKSGLDILVLENFVVTK